MKYSSGVRALASILLVVVNFAAGVESASAVTCQPTKALSFATKTSLSVSPGVQISKYQFGAGVANNTSYQSRFAVAKASMQLVSLKAPHSKWGVAANQTSLASSVTALAQVNGDYFDFGTNLPFSPFGASGTVSYSNFGYKRALGFKSQTATLATGIVGTRNLTSGSISIPVKGINVPGQSITNSTLAFTSEFQSTSLPANTYAVKVSSGRVAAVFAAGTRSKPTSGTIFTASGTAVASLKRLLIGASVSFSIPTSTNQIPVVDYVKSSGTIKSTGGALLASISAVNFDNSSRNSSVILYDATYNGYTPSAPTVTIDSTGSVTSVISLSVSGPVSSGVVLKFFGTRVSYLSNFHVGDHVVVSRSFASKSGSVYQTVIGAHAVLLANGLNVQACTIASETVRPRTAIGWDAKGNYYLASTTMGLHWNDGMYRVGGSTLHQLGDWLKAAGATNAVSLDGGGSTTMLALVSGAYVRQDLPTTEWMRSIPQTVAMVSR